MEFTRADSPADWREARAAVQRYADSLEFDLEFQDFDHEIDSLAEEYGPPGGCFLLAREEGHTIGCVGLRKIDEAVCEMKRLYVFPGQRGRRIGQRLAEAIIEEGRRLGYERMRLDTVPSMKAARALYESLGFRNIPSYRYNPIPGAPYMELQL